MRNQPTTYKTAGVDIEKAENAFKNIKDRITNTHTPQVLSGIGLFGGFFDISEHGCKHPVLVSSVDGVGTKLKVAILANRHRTVGQDIVNHCINDIACCGAKPLYFLDYFACGSLDENVYEDVITGITIACKNADVALIGGETAEMPDFYQASEYDMSGTIVGIVDKGKIIDGSKIVAGDVLLGITGNGLHTNGYTLARHVLLNHFELDAKPESLSGTIADELLKIHPNYYTLIKAATEETSVSGISHVTGGGIQKNTNRLLAKGLSLQIDWNAWETPAIFKLIQETGNVPEADMRQTFNMGIGLVFIAKPENQSKISQIAEKMGHSCLQIGKVC